MTLTVSIKPSLDTIRLRPLKKFLRRRPKQGNHMRNVIYIVLLIFGSSSGEEQIPLSEHVPDLLDFIIIGVNFRPV